MDIQVHSVHFTADKKLVDFVNEKVGKLELFFDNIIATEVFLRLDKSQDGENKIAEIINRRNRRRNYKDEIKFEAKTHLENFLVSIPRSQR